MTNEEGKSAAGTAGQDTPLEEQVTQDVGGVQGSPDDEGDMDETQGRAAKPGSPADQPAPDAGEIEWAGQLLKRPPHPDN